MTARDRLEPAAPWTFDAEVAECFDDMLNRSIPGLTELRTVIREVVDEAAPARSTVVDLGCSLGGTLAALDDGHRQLYGFDTSRPMVERARLALPHAHIDLADITQPLAHPPADLTTLVFTLQFLDPSDRVPVLAGARRRARPGSLLILAEKTAVPRWAEEVITSAYHDRKRRNGYTPAQIASKAAALNGVLRPQTPARIESELVAAGWFNPVRVWGSLQFAAWIAAAPRDEGNRPMTTGEREKVEAGVLPCPARQKTTPTTGGEHHV